jgi:hypothetical protein
MANWGGLNNGLNAFYLAVNELLPDRARDSDGARADANHGSNSEHQEDSDGTVDALDLDANYLDSGTSTGNDQERQILDCLNLDYMRDNRWYLIISHGKIAKYNVDGGKWKPYTGTSNPHDKHSHRQVRQDREDNGAKWNLPNTEALLREWGMFMTPADIQNAVLAALRSPEGHEEIGQAVHDQLIGKTGLSIATHLDRTYKDIVWIKDALNIKTIPEDPA